MIRCEELTRYYGTFTAVDRLSVEIPKGSICALVGPNGAGKTTTLRMLGTLLPPSRGRAFIGGYDVVRQATQVRRLIGYLPEAFQLYDDLTVDRFLGFFARAYDLDPDAASGRISEYLERLGLKEKRRVRVGTLSRGMKQRLGVAKSFLHDPEVVLLDEPASGLDPVARAELRDFLRYQQHLGKTVLVSSHVLKELADFCDHLLIIQNGWRVEFGPLTGADGVLARHAENGQGGKPHTLRVLRDAPRLEVFLERRPEVSELKRLDQTFTFCVAGGEEEAAKLLNSIAAAGFQVSAFIPETVDLEAVYRKVAKAEE
jgi:ABC-2 type transport system ATP-binding protein